MAALPTPGGASCFPIHGGHPHTPASGGTWPQDQTTTSMTSYPGPGGGEEGVVAWSGGSMGDYHPGPETGPDEFQILHVPSWSPTMHGDQEVSGVSGPVDGGGADGSYHLAEPSFD